ncbi:hypothetical protein LINPERPRIM_LOCUS37757 [Linum perenne]
MLGVAGGDDLCSPDPRRKKGDRKCNYGNLSFWEAFGNFLSSGTELLTRESLGLMLEFVGNVKVGHWEVREVAVWYFGCISPFFKSKRRTVRTSGIGTKRQSFSGRIQCLQLGISDVPHYF